MKTLRHLNFAMPVCHFYRVPIPGTHGGAGGEDAGGTPGGRPKGARGPLGVLFRANSEWKGAQEVRMYDLQANNQKVTKSMLPAKSPGLENWGVDVWKSSVLRPSKVLRLPGRFIQPPESFGPSKQFEPTPPGWFNQAPVVSGHFNDRLRACEPL